MSQASEHEYIEFIEIELAQSPVSAVRIIETLVHHAHAVHASDLHIDPSETFLTVRLRVDGTLRDAHRLPIQIHPEVLARLKILASLRIDEHQTPQDGRFQFQLRTSERLDVRISIAPTYYGENVVLRLLSIRDDLSTLESLGLSTEHQELIKRVLARPHGLILVTGPTGSGKTSTLYVLLNLLNSRDSSIITIEDPIEYSIEGINQIQANRHTGLSFSEGLRSILRQDPDILGIGEIRDKETATLATHAALTGHLVVSTLHTIDAPTTLLRLMDLGIEPYLIASTVQLIISERLVQRLCTLCRIPDVRSEYFISKGCGECNYTGIEGRLGIFEVLYMNDDLREAIERKASVRELHTLAHEQGMITFYNDALGKASKGMISMKEIQDLLHG